MNIHEYLCVDKWLESLWCGQDHPNDLRNVCQPRCPTFHIANVGLTSR